MAWLVGDVARWVVANESQRLHKIDAIAKDAAAWDEAIAPVARWVEVWDKTDGYLYSMSVEKFNDLKALLPYAEGTQYFVRRNEWLRRKYVE